MGQLRQALWSRSTGAAKEAQWKARNSSARGSATNLSLVLLKVLFLALIFLTLGASALAQEATIVGTITDSSGAVVPRAKVSVVNADKSFTRNLLSNSAGEYLGADLPIGSYVIIVEAPGFRRLVRSGVTLQVGQTLRVDLQLMVGQPSQQVTVQGNLPHVQTETAAISDVITGSQISNLELNGRQFVALTLLVPGASPDNGMDLTNLQNGGDIAISFNGGRNRYNAFTIDGNNNQDEGGYGSMVTYPSLDSVAEFSVSTSTYGAELGKLGSAHIEVATKSGTKEFHGDAYEYVRNDKFDANPWFINQQVAPVGGNAPKSPLKWNDFGYTLGGPVYIPGHYNTDRSKTFFFWSQEWHRFNQAQVINQAVPSLRMRSGDFSECDPASANANPVVQSGCVLPQLTAANGTTTSYDTVQSMPGFSPQAFANAQDLINSLVPLPNSGPITYVFPARFITDWREELIRVDQNISTKTSVFVRYTQDSDFNLIPTGNKGGDTYDTMQTDDHEPGYNAVLHLLHTFRPNLINDTQVGFFTNIHTWRSVVGSSSPSHSIDRPADFVMNHLFPVNASNTLLPALAVSGGVPFSFVMDAGPAPYENAAPTYNLKDDVTWMLGKHTLKFGFFFEKYQKNQDLQTGADTQGFLTFDGSGPISTLNGLADMFLGNIHHYAEAVVTKNGIPIGGYGRGYWRMTDFEPYFQDNWKVSSKLTLNVGLRYYYYVPQHDVQNPPVDVNFLPAQYNPALQAQLDANDNLIPGSGFNYTMFGNGVVQCGRGAIPTGCTHLSNRNLGPRFGFAYDPWGSGKTVIRGGYGIYFDSTSEGGAEGMGGNPPPALTSNGANIVGYGNIVPGALPPESLFLAVPLSTKFPSVQQFSLGIQHEFSGNNLLTVSYVGSLGRHNDRLFNLNQIPIGVTTANAPALAGMSGVDALSGNPNPVPLCDGQGNCQVQPLLINQLTTADYFVPYRGFSSANSALDMNPLSAVSSYHSLQAEFRHAFGHGLSFQASYTWSHAIDDSSTDGFLSGVDDSNLSRWRGTGDINRTQMFVMNYVYDLPFFGSSSNPFLRQGLGGWKLSGITSFYTGQPINFGCGISGFSTGIGGNVQCNTVGPLKVHKHVGNDPTFGPALVWFDPSVATQPNAAQLFANHQPGMFGYMGRNVLTGPGRNNWDIALLKDFKTPWFRSESSTLQFRLETFNTFNHPQWNSINSGCNGDPNPDGSPAFGRSCASGLVNGILNGEVNGTWPPRVMQLALKFTF